MVDLLDNIFQIYHDERITAEQALDHPALIMFHDLEDEPSAEYLNDDDLLNMNCFSIGKIKSILLNL